VDNTPIVSNDEDEAKEAVHSSSDDQLNEELIDTTGEATDDEQEPTTTSENGVSETVLEDESQLETVKDELAASRTTADRSETNQTGELLEDPVEVSAPVIPADEEKEPVESTEDEPTENQAIDEAASHEKESIANTPSEEMVASAEARVAETASPNDPDQLEKFSHQMQRVEANYQEERKFMEQEHALQIEKIQASLNHKACFAAQRELEKRLMAEMEEKDEQLHEIGRSNEGYRLKLDVLKREVQGTQQLLEARDSDMGKANEDHGRYLKTLEQKVRESEGRASKSNEEVRRLRTALESSTTDLVALKEEHGALKARVKIVAAELKDRRVECRELGSEVVEFREKNDRLQDNLDNMKYQLTHQDKSSSEKNEEMEQLRAKLVDAATDLMEANKAVEAQEIKGEKALAEYKKKAQASLSLANSRTAAAVQAKEEAELDCRAARTTADSAMDRAVNAELTSKQALAEAKAHVKSMESEKAEAVKNLERKNDELMKVELEHTATQEQLQQSLSAKEKVSDELKEALAKLEEQQAKAVALQEKLLISEERVQSLVGDVATLRESLQRAEVAAASTDKHDQKQVDAKTSTSVTETEEAGRRSSDDETIRMLQQELHDANEAIEDLKEGLKNAVQSNGSPHQEGQLDQSEGSTDHVESNGGNSTPLFFAMEKQAELTIARNEINRLANLYGNVQSEKMEAFEAMQDMKKRMEDAEARLLRYEKLGTKRNGGPSQESGAGDTSIHSSGEAQQPSSEEARSNSSGVNIEYLKNVMLSYLNAKTLAEKKALVPVISAVLCLTADESKNALKNVEESVSLGGVGASLFESFSGRF
jgi:chromosome segregation ATPase